MTDEVSRGTDAPTLTALDPKAAEHSRLAVQPGGHAPAAAPASSSYEEWVKRGREKVAAMRAAKPFHDSPSFDDVVEIVAEMMLHAEEDHPPARSEREPPRPAPKP